MDTSPAAKTWNQRMKIRNSGGEDTANWWVNDKFKLHQFCDKNGFPMPEAYHFWKTPDELDLTDAPVKFVLKPTVMFSAWGVMLLERTSDGTFFEELTGRSLSIDQIRSEQQRAYDICKFKGSYRLMMEERIESSIPGKPIPFDYKVSVFYDTPEQVHQIDRNTNPIEFAFFDGSFEPLDLTGKIESDWSSKGKGEHHRPPEHEEMLTIATDLTKALRTPFMRIDMFSGPSGPVVGELTPSPGDAYYGNNFRYTDSYEIDLGKAWDAAESRMGAQS
ncbi:hypothetical protein AWH69_15210 [Janibacter melonis]|uniref:ATP-grasp domain-containing protein n=1 Tax=Janibacter melonis TaxID=262209 RepID=A0A176Q958_9MICO|nr:ATP-grasp fold amidoligase family protein [Janibacter melonis]OAB86238.1 hypothetical protein AWH69_15210 [Janibacter melonis]